MVKRHSKRLWAALGLLYIGLLSAAAGQSEPDVAELSFETETIVSGLKTPWNIAFLPSGDILVTERDGRLRVVRDGRILDVPVSGLPDIYVSQRAGLFLQSGLFEAEPHPRFEDNGWVYLTYSLGTDRANTLALGRARYVDDGAPRLEEFEELFRADALRSTHEHYGGRMAWMPDGTLLLTSGEGAAYRFKAQDLGSHFGKILRLTDEGEPAGGNPFEGRPNVLAEVFSFGHRNPQGIAVTADGRIFSNEHGPLGGDKLNAITPGANFGWPIASYGRDYSGAEITPLTRYPGTEDPIVTWTPAIAPSSLLYYDGDRYPSLSGTLLSTGLVGKQIRAVDPDRTNTQAALLSDRGIRWRDIALGPDGFLYTIGETPDGDGLLVRIQPMGGAG